MPYQIVINTNNSFFKNAISVFLRKVQGSKYLLNEVKKYAVNDLDSINEILPRWPSWAAGNVTIGGNSRNESLFQISDPVYISDTRENNLNNFFDWFNDNFDWAIYRYFTTYQGSLVFFITKDKQSFELMKNTLNSINCDLIYQSYEDSNAALEHLLNASFYMEANKEGLLAHEIAMKFDQENPIMISCISGNENYKIYNWDTDKYAAIPWYIKHFKKLTLVDKFNVSENNLTYYFHRVDDLNSYLELWSMSDTDYAIVEATVSTNTDLSSLKNIIKNHNGYIDLLQASKGISKWVYSLVYGGGSDEYHGVFGAKDSRITNFLWDQLEQNEVDDMLQISRF